MRSTVLLLASTALAVLLTYAASTSVPTAGAQTTPAKPNFVFILVDDMRTDDLRYMPKTRSLLGQQGMHFREAYVSNALCCPSRATIMRGQYAHNTGVWGNINGPNGGWEGYKYNGNEQDNVATRLNNAGYRTGLFGKYFNGYDKGTTYVPPGWDRWFALFGFRYLGYDANDNGRIAHFGTAEDDYVTDVLSRRTQGFIRASVEAQVPFFAYVTPIAPHGPATPARRHQHTHDGVKAPRLPSFNEGNISDKPPWISSLPRLSDVTIANIDDRHENRVESLQAVDDLVEGVVDMLRAKEALRNTYIVFTSDNGWHHGEHRIPKEKTQPYEESSRVPLIIRGPGVPADSTTSKLAVNTDYFPTFTDLAGIEKPAYVDGRSLRPVLQGNATTWRSAILMERQNDDVPSKSFYGIRAIDGRKYLEYGGGFRELYDLNSDPYELVNSYNASSPPAYLVSHLQDLKTCRPEHKDIDDTTVSCYVAENGPQPQ
jgi:N-acetylglucosamine-6-sulfatase